MYLENTENFYLQKFKWRLALPMSVNKLGWLYFRFNYIYYPHINNNVSYDADIMYKANTSKRTVRVKAIVKYRSFACFLLWQ
jgi:hypothetical protein